MAVCVGEEKKDALEGTTLSCLSLTQSISTTTLVGADNFIPFAVRVKYDFITVPHLVRSELGVWKVFGNPKISAIC